MNLDLVTKAALITRGMSEIKRLGCWGSIF